MSRQRNWQDTRHEPCTHTVPRVLVAQPGLLTSEYVRLVVDHTPAAIKHALHRLRVAGYAVSRPMEGWTGRGRWKAVTWHPTAALVRMVTRGEVPTVSRYLRAADVREDDGWTPRPYVHPIRAQMLGRRAA